MVFVIEIKYAQRIFFTSEFFSHIKFTFHIISKPRLAFGKGKENINKFPVNIVVRAGVLHGSKGKTRINIVLSFSQFC